MASVRLEGLRKTYGSYVAVEEVSLDIADKEFVVFVGPSGCGKTTTLRMIAGLEKASAGSIYIGDRRVNDISPAKRNIAMVFQNFALYPHFTARENIGFGLEGRRIAAHIIKKKVDEVAELLELNTLLDRYPADMSGGQKQRVALGRAIVRDPDVLLMDEPLSNLDARLRAQMRAEIKRLTREIGTTTIFVTHDQVEAMTLGDRIAVMYGGFARQFDKPMNVYDRPQETGVGEIIGSPPMNFLDGDIRVDAGTGDVTLDFGPLGVALHRYDKARLKEAGVGDGDRIVAGIRPEFVIVGRESVNGDERSLVRMEIELIETHGPETILTLRAGAVRLTCRTGDRREFRERDQVEVFLNERFLLLYDKTTRKLLLS